MKCFKFDVPNTGNKENKETTRFKQEEKSREKKTEHETEHEKTNNSPATDLNSGDRETNERQLFFHETLKSLEKCKTYEDLEKLCKT